MFGEEQINPPFNLPAYPQPGLVGFVICPPNTVLEDYVKQVYASGRLTLSTDRAQIINNVRVTTTVLRDLKFPTTATGRGSYVACLQDSNTKAMVCVGVLVGNGESQPNANAGVQQLAASGPTGNTLIQIDPVTGQAILSADAGVIIQALNKDNTGPLKIGSDLLNILITTIATLEAGQSITLVVQNKQQSQSAKITFTLSLANGFSISVIDDSGNEQSESMGATGYSVDAQTIKLGNGESPALKGDKQIELQNKLLSALASAVITTPVGPGAFSPATIAQFEQIQGEQDSTLSTKVTLE